MKLGAKGFTLMEVIIVTIMVGVMASLAFTNFGTVMEKMRAKEGENTIRTVTASIERFRVENNNTMPANLAQTDFDLPLSANFGGVICPAMNGCYVQRSTGDYRIQMNAANVAAINCVGLNAHGLELCDKMGY